MRPWSRLPREVALGAERTKRRPVLSAHPALSALKALEALGTAQHTQGQHSLPCTEGHPNIQIHWTRVLGRSPTCGSTRDVLGSAKTGRKRKPDQGKQASPAPSPTLECPGRQSLALPLQAALPGRAASSSQDGL